MIIYSIWYIERKTSNRKSNKILIVFLFLYSFFALLTIVERARRWWIQNFTSSGKWFISFVIATRTNTQTGIEYGIDWRYKNFTHETKWQGILLGRTKLCRKFKWRWNGKFIGAIQKCWFGESILWCRTKVLWQSVKLADLQNSNNKNSHSQKFTFTIQFHRSLFNGL